MVNLKKFIKECKRVWTITKKPTNEEYQVMIKVAGLGILAIGLIGFIISIIGRAV